MAFQIHQEQLLSHPREQVFRFFASAENLNLLTPPWLGFNILTPLPIEMAVGTIIEYRIRLHGLPLTWRSEITEWQPPISFCDEQRGGPYRFWMHRHTFAESAGRHACNRPRGLRRSWRGAGQPAVRRWGVEEDLRLPKGAARGAVPGHRVTARSGGPFVLSLSKYERGTPRATSCPPALRQAQDERVKWHGACAYGFAAIASPNANAPKAPGWSLHSSSPLRH